SRRGWVLISQKELAERWGVTRQRVCIAINELVAWKYLRKRSQAERGESFCVYKVLLDDEDDDEGVSRTGDTPLGEGVSRTGDTGVTQEVTRVSPSIGHSTDNTDKTDSPPTPPGGPGAGDEVLKSSGRNRDKSVEDMLDRVALVPKRER